MSRIEIPGAASIRSQVGIVPEDPEVFRPIEIKEALEAVGILERDETISEEIRALLSVGILLDLMPGHLTPRKSMIAERLRVSVRTIRRREIDWELVDPRIRFDLTHRASRLVIAARGVHD